jgi:hypothetical protein
MREREREREIYISDGSDKQVLIVVGKLLVLKTNRKLLHKTMQIKKVSMAMLSLIFCGLHKLCI